jgi:hypothetical protein
MERKIQLNFKYITYIIVIIIVAYCGVQFLDYLKVKARNDRIEELDRESRSLKQDIDTLNNYLDSTK